MLESITWADYLKAMAIIVAGYYMIVGLLYYRSELRPLVRGKKPSGEHQPETKKVKEDMKKKNRMDWKEMQELNDLMKKIRAIMGEAGMGADKEDLFSRIRPLLASYGGLHLPGSSNALRDHVIAPAENICGVGFSEEEIDEVWQSLPPQN